MNSRICAITGTPQPAPDRSAFVARRWSGASPRMMCVTPHVVIIDDDRGWVGLPSERSGTRSSRSLLANDLALHLVVDDGLALWLARRGITRLDAGGASAGSRSPSGRRSASACPRRAFSRRLQVSHTGVTAISAASGEQLLATSRWRSALELLIARVPIETGHLSRESRPPRRGSNVRGRCPRCATGTLPFVCLAEPVEQPCAPRRCAGSLSAKARNG
jgi:hypothetical protein